VALALLVDLAQLVALARLAFPTRRVQMRRKFRSLR